MPIKPNTLHTQFFKLISHSLFKVNYQCKWPQWNPKIKIKQHTQTKYTRFLSNSLKFRDSHRRLGQAFRGKSCVICCTTETPPKLPRCTMRRRLVSLSHLPKNQTKQKENSKMYKHSINQHHKGRTKCKSEKS